MGAAVEEGVTPPAEAATTASAPPAAKRRKGLLGAVAQAQVTGTTPDEEASAIDAQVQAEIERFDIISQKILSAGLDHPYYQGKLRLNLRAFWADHKKEIHIGTLVSLSV